MFEYYDSKNKIPEFRYKIMENILNNFSIELHGIKWFEERRKDFEGKGHDNWVNMIRNNSNYHIILYIKDGDIKGFLCYEYLNDNQVMICEIQIIREYRYKGYVKKLLKEMMNQINKDKCNTFLAFINSNNEHSINTFTHIGMINTGKYYEISYDSLNKYLNNI